jgi:hypothetical protein
VSRRAVTAGFNHSAAIDRDLRGRPPTRAGAAAAGRR